MTQVPSDLSSSVSNASEQASGPTTAAASKACVLIVEDDRVAQNIFTKICTHVGHEVIVVDNLAHAREELHKKIFVDLVILDSQLGKDWGWQFLKDLRNDALYKSLPVVVYTAHTERDLLLQYIELGVQAVRAKPIKGEVVYTEIDKALQINWRGNMLHSPEAVCERLKIQKPDYIGMINTAALELDRELKELKGLLGSRNTPKMFESLRQMRTQGNVIGMPAIELVANAIQAAIQQGELPKAIRGIQSAGLLVTFLNQLSAGFHGTTPVTRQRSAPTEKAPDLPFHAPSLPSTKEGSAAFGRKMAATPAWIMGKYFSRLRKIVVFTPEDISKIIDEAASSEPFLSFLNIAREVEQIPSAGIAQALTSVAALPSFSPGFSRIAEQLGIQTEGLESQHLVGQLGPAETLILCSAAKACQAGLVESPLNLSHLLIHSVATGLITRQLGQFFHLENTHLLFTGGLSHDIGRWLLAYKEPGFYSMAIGLAQEQSTDLAMAERMTYGISHEEAGLQFLSKSSQRQLLIDIAGYHNNPLSDAVAQENRISVALVHLANDLAYAASTDDSGESERLNVRMSSKHYPTWKVLERAGVQLPLPPQDLVKTFAPMASSSNWIALVLASWASGTRRG